jgi:RNA polymerase sigma-32 factor
MTTMTLPVPSLSANAGSLESYIQSVNRFPILSAQEEFEYGRRLKYENDVNAARELVLSHLRLVVATARQYLGYGLPHADLIQEGNVGLMKAVRRFDPDRGVRLVSFAVHWIRAEMHEYIIRNWRMVKIATTKAQRKLFFNLRSLKQSLNALTTKETAAMAQELGVKPEEVREMEVRLTGGDIALDPAPGDEDSDWVSPVAYLADPDAEPTKQIERKERDALASEGLNTALAALDDRSRHIIEARWLREDEEATLHELAAEYGISAERVRQIEAKAMQKMRAALAN